MTFIRRQTLTPKEANKLHKLGFILSFKYSFDKDSDLYEVYVKDSEFNSTAAMEKVIKALGV